MMSHWTDRQRHLKRLGLTTPEGWPRPNASQYLKNMIYRGCESDAMEAKPPKFFLSGGSVGICYRIRCNRVFKISEVIWMRHAESREILKACVEQAEQHPLRTPDKS